MHLQRIVEMVGDDNPIFGVLLPRRIGFAYFKSVFTKMPFDHSVFIRLFEQL